MNSRPRIFLDLDGPLLEVSSRHYSVYVELVAEFGGRPLAKSDYWEAKREKTHELRILELSGLGGPILSEYNRQKIERIETPSALKLDQLQLGAREALDRMGKTAELVLITLRHDRRALAEQLDKLKLRRYFSSVLSGRDSESAGWIIKCQMLFRQFGQFSQADWLVGDTETDILAAQAVGVRSAAVANGMRSREFLRKYSPSLLLASVVDFRLSPIEHEDCI